MSRVSKDPAPASPAPLNGKFVDDLRSASQRLAELADALQAREAALEAREEEFKKVVTERDHYKDLALGVLRDQAKKDLDEIEQEGGLEAWAMARGARPAEEVFNELFHRGESK
jgi:hypothetical protein